MSKIRIKLILNKDIFLFEGIKSRNLITYKDQDILVKFDVSDTIKMIRENDDYKLELIFINNCESIGSYFLKQYNKKMDITINTINLFIGDNYFEISYNIVESDQAFNLKLEFEEI